MNELPLSFYKFTHLVKVILLFIRRFIRFRYKREQLLFELIPLYERERENGRERERERENERERTREIENERDRE